MEKRRMDKLGIETSLLGFGCMRFPLTADGKIEEVQSEKMMDMAYEAGVNYFDTAYPYHNGESEPFVGRVLEKYDRSSYYLATKLPIWSVEKEEDVRRIFEDQLQRLSKDYVDFYLLHGIGKERWEKIKELKIIETCEEFRKEGKIKYLGFSFHDNYEAFEEILSGYDWDFCQIQYNYMDTGLQAGDKGYALTEKLDIPVVVMEPVRGGNLAGFSEDIDQKFHVLNNEASIASYALRWVGSHPNVKVILSGMSSMEQTSDNIKTFEAFKPLDAREEDVIQDVVKILRSRVQNGCTGCGYCMPCPAWVDIPGNFRVWNDYHIYQSYSAAKFAWEKGIEESAKPKNCIRCGKCEEACPQNISIRENLERVQQELDQARESSKE